MTRNGHRRTTVRGAIWAIACLAMVPFSPAFSPAFSLVFLGAASPAAAATVNTSATYDLTLRGLRIATFTFAGEETDNRYSARAGLKSAGLLGLVKTLGFDASAQGSPRNGVFRPVRYVEKADTGSRKSEAELGYRNGVPEIRRVEPVRPPRDRDVAPQTQGGTIDPMTAIFTGLRNQPRAGLCRTDSYMFDGRRRSRVVLSQPKAEGPNIVCSGLYQRIAGFSEKEMAEKTDFPFRITYVPGPGGLMQASEIAMETLYGPARLTRR